MARAENKTTPKVIGGWLYWDQEAVELDTPAWAAWLADHTTFYLESDRGTFTARRETVFWYAYCRHHGKQYKRYLGKPEQLTRDHLLTVAEALATKAGA